MPSKHFVYVLYQNKNDSLTYIINKKNNALDFKTSLKIKDNPFIIGFLNYEKNQKNETLIKVEGLRGENNLTLIKSFYLNEEKNKIEIKDLIFNKKFEIINLDKISKSMTKFWPYFDKFWHSFR